MKRREFITLLGGAGAASSVCWPLAARAQPAMPVIGRIDAGGGANPNSVAAWRKGLSEMGFVEGRNVLIEYRSAVQYDQIAAQTVAGEFVRRQISVIVAVSSSNAVRAAKAATTSIPIVFATGSDPVKLGVVASLNRPGGNATGVTYFARELGAKRLELLRELVPQAVTIALLNNPTLSIEGSVADIQAAARSVGQRMLVLSASTEAEINAAFATASQERVGAILVDTDSFFNSRRDQLVALAARYRIPSSYPASDYAIAGGLTSYGDDRMESHRQVGLYTGRVLKGDKPADLPVLQPTKFEFAINLRTAKALGITFPPSFHLRADQMIE